MEVQGQVIHLVVLGLLLAASPGASLLPGAKFRLSQKGLDYAAGKAIDNVSVQGEHIPDQHGKSHVKVGKVEYDVTGMVVTSFGKPNSKVTVTPGKGIAWQATGASASVHGNWRYKYRYHFIKIRDHGSFDVSASGIDFSISAILGVDQNGRPTIKSTGCSSHVGRVKVKFHGGASWLYNLFDHAIANSLKKALSDAMCKSATKAMNTDGAKKLAELVVVTDIGSHHEMLLDYRLTQAPVFGQGYMDVMLKGEFEWKKAPTTPPFTPQAFPASTDASKMVYIWGSDYVVNSYIYAAFQHHLTHANVSRKDGDGDFLNTTCPHLGTGCIGNFLYQVAVMFPHSSVKIDMGASELPHISITPSGINFHAVGDMTLYAETPKNGTVYLFKIQVTVDMQVMPSIDGSTLKGKVGSLKPTIKVLNSKVGNLTDKFMNWLFKMASDRFIVKKLNKLGEAGIRIPDVKDCKFVNPILKLNAGNLLISTDLDWSPKRAFVLDGNMHFHHVKHQGNTLKDNMLK